MAGRSLARHRAVLALPVQRVARHLDVEAKVPCQLIAGVNRWRSRFAHFFVASDRAAAADACRGDAAAEPEVVVGVAVRATVNATAAATVPTATTAAEVAAAAALALAQAPRQHLSDDFEHQDNPIVQEAQEDDGERHPGHELILLVVAPVRKSGAAEHDAAQIHEHAASQ